MRFVSFFETTLLILKFCTKTPPTTNATQPGNTAYGEWQMACGENYPLVLKPDHSAWAIANNAFGQFSNGTTTGSHKFIKMMDSEIVIALR